MKKVFTLASMLVFLMGMTIAQTTPVTKTQIKKNTKEIKNTSNTQVKQAKVDSTSTGTTTPKQSKKKCAKVKSTKK